MEPDQQSQVSEDTGLDLSELSLTTSCKEAECIIRSFEQVVSTSFLKDCALEFAKREKNPPHDSGLWTLFEVPFECDDDDEDSMVCPLCDDRYEVEDFCYCYFEGWSFLDYEDSDSDNESSTSEDVRASFQRFVDDS